MCLTDGKTYGKTVVLPADADHSVWYEITAEEAEKRMNDEIAIEEEMQND